MTTLQDALMSAGLSTIEVVIPRMKCPKCGWSTPEQDEELRCPICETPLDVYKQEDNNEDNE